MNFYLKIMPSNCFECASVSLYGHAFIVVFSYYGSLSCIIYVSIYSPLSGQRGFVIGCCTQYYCQVMFVRNLLNNADNGVVPSFCQQPILVADQQQHHGSRNTQDKFKYADVKEFQMFSSISIDNIIIIIHWYVCVVQKKSQQITKKHWFNLLEIFFWQRIPSENNNCFVFEH